MALSDWDLLVIDNTGENTGVLKGYGDPDERGSVRIYKNWVYVNHPKMWIDGNGYNRDTIAEIQFGDINIAGFQITAKRHEGQDAVFVLANTSKYNDKNPCKWMIGIGCRGYTDATDLLISDLNIDPNEWEDISMFFGFSKTKTVGLTCFGPNDRFEQFSIPYDEKYESTWTGVLPSTVVAFREWLLSILPEKDHSGLDQEWVNSLDWNNLNRFNQGDAYFSDHLGIELKTSIPGEADVPIADNLMINYIV